jgi:membrane associated rhomboid family serine protease
MIPLIGASASIYGVLVACAFMYPDVRISRLFPPVTLRLRTFALVIIGIAAATILFNFNNAGGEAGHLGGIIMGAIIMLAWKYRLVNRF